MLKRTLKSLAAVLTGNGLGVVSTLVLVPLFVQRWSPLAYGEWLTLTSLVGYFGLLDFGIGSATSNRLVQAHATGDTEGYRRTQHAAMRLYCVSAVLGTLGLLGSAGLMMFFHWPRFGALSVQSASLIWVFCGLQLVWALPASLISAVPYTLGNQAMSQWLINGQRALLTVSSISALVAGATPVGVAATQLTSFVISVCVCWVVVRRLAPGRLPSLRDADPEANLGILRSSWLFFGITLAVSGSQYASVLLVSAVFGGVAVAVFASSRTIANTIRQGLSVLNAVAFPELTRLEATRNAVKLAAMHRWLVVATSTISIGLGALVWLEGPRIITLWTHGKIAADATLLRWFAVQLILQSPWIASSILTAAASRHAKLTASYIAANSIGLLAAWLLTDSMGLAALPCGAVIGEAVACYHFVVRDTCAMVGQPYVSFALRTWGLLAAQVLVTFSVAAAAHWTIRTLNAWSIPLVGMAGMATALAFAWGVWLVDDDRQAFKLHAGSLMLSFRSGAVK